MASVSGFQCRFDGCTYVVKDIKTARQHVQYHKTDLDVHLLEVKVQKIFNSNLHKYCMVESGDVGIHETTEAGRMLAALRQ